MRYFRLLGCFARYCLVREMTFRINFIARCITGMVWLLLLVMFFQLVFLRTDRIGDWGPNEFFFFLGTSLLLNTLVDSFFLENFTNLSELIRTGDLDFALLKPIDEQFLLSFQKVDWSEIPNILFAMGLIGYGAWNTGVVLTPGTLTAYFILVAAGLAVLYSMLLVMASSSVWFVRNTGLYEAWFYVTQFARYPAEIYQGWPVGVLLRMGLTYVIPVLAAVNLPARQVAGLFVEPALIAYLLVAAIASLVVSRWFFRFSLSRYRSASS